MPTVHAGDNILVTFNGLLLGQRTMSTFGYVIDSVTGTPDQNVFLTSLFSALTDADRLKDAYEHVVPANWNGTEIWCQVIRPTRFQKRTFAWPGFPSNWPVDAQTANIAAVVERRGDLARRNNISTLHVPISGDPTAVVGGAMTPAMFSALSELANQVVSQVEVITGAAVLIPSILNGPLAVDVTPITNAFPQATSRVMRRRTVGLGI